MKVWRDYRVAIPVKIRRELGFQPGTEVEFIELGDRIAIVKAVDESQKEPAMRASNIRRKKSKRG